MNKYVAVFDLDGVLADFDGEFKRISGLDWGNFSDNTPVDLSKTKKWALIKAQPSFFGILPWVLGAKILWEHINTICSTFILSAASENVPSSKQEKIDWCKEQLKFTDYDISIRCIVKFSYMLDLLLF
jgi:5'(3')-deoxyribonucleotidase